MGRGGRWTTHRLHLCLRPLRHVPRPQLDALDRALEQHGLIPERIEAPDQPMAVVVVTVSVSAAPLTALFQRCPQHPAIDVVEGGDLGSPDLAQVLGVREFGGNARDVGGDGVEVHHRGGRGVVAVIVVGGVVPLPHW